MEKFRSMQLLPSRNHVVTSLKYQDVYCVCIGSQRYPYEKYAVLKSRFVSAKVRLRRVTTKEEKGKKLKKSIFATKTWSKAQDKHTIRFYGKKYTKFFQYKKSKKNI